MTNDSGARRLSALALAFVLLAFVAPALPAQGQEAQEELTIELKSFQFDPREGPPDLAPEMRYADDEAPTHYLLQLRAPLDPQTRAELTEEFGLELSQFVPNQTFIERISGETARRLRADPRIRAVTPYQPAFKISGSIGEVEYRTKERQAVEGLLLRAILFPEADPQAAARALRAAGADNLTILDDRHIGGVARIRFTLPSRQGLPRIARIGEVKWIEEVGETIFDNSSASATIQSGDGMTPAIWNRDIRGQGQIIGVIDSRVPDINNCFFRDPVNNTPGIGHRKIVDLRDDLNLGSGGHGTFVSGAAAGDDFNAPGTDPARGGAHAGRLVAGARADAIQPGSSLLAELMDAAQAGARIHTNSWHDNTAGAGNPATYNQNAADVDAFIWQNEDNVVLGSMGNVGEEQGPPGTAKNAIGISAAQADPNEDSFGDGNDGPTADGRRKPDTMTVGCGIRSAQNGTACGSNLSGVCATSWATPHGAAAAALIRQYFAEGWHPTGARVPADGFGPTGALVKAALVNAAIDMGGIPGYPGTREGWGIVRLEDVLAFSGDARSLRVWDTRNVAGLTTGETRTHMVPVASSAEPLKVTLAWSDPPGAAGARSPRVNDLNLRVTTPDGAQTFLGNVFAGGTSTAGGAADTVNTVEQVLVAAPQTGEWTLEVSASAVNIGSPGQGYALVATGDIGKRRTIYKYAAKLLCGMQDDAENTRLARGFYATAINILNQNETPVKFRKALSLTYPPAAQRPGAVLPISTDKLRPDEALEVDCIDIEKRLFPNGLPRPYIKGFVTLTSEQPLEVTAVYSSRALDARVCCRSEKGKGCPRKDKDAKRCKPHDGRGGKGCCFDIPGAHSSIDVEAIKGRRVMVKDRPERKLPDLVPRPAFDPAPPNMPGQLPQDYCAAPAGGLGPADRIRVLVHNQGDGPAGPSVTTVSFSPSAQIQPVVATLSMAAPGLDPNESFAQVFDIPEGCYPGGGSGCSFRITVDGGMPPSVVESNEANNVVVEGCPGIVP